jgi:hypothetical protein
VSPDVSVWSEAGGWVLFWVAVALAAVVWAAALGLARAADRDDTTAQQPPQTWHLEVCSRSRCHYPGSVVRREQSTRQLVRVCTGHAWEGDQRGWWAPDYPFDREASDVVDQATRITREAAT